MKLRVNWHNAVVVIYDNMPHLYVHAHSYRLTAVGYMAVIIYVVWLHYRYVNVNSTGRTWAASGLSGAVAGAWSFPPKLIRFCFGSRPACSTIARVSSGVLGVAAAN